MHALPDMMRAFAEATTDYPRLLQVVADQISTLIGDGCFVALLSEDGRSLQPVSVRFRDPATDEVARGFLTAGPIQMEGSSLGVRVVRTRDPVLLPRVDLEALARAVASNHAALVRSLAISSFLLLPLEIHGRALGFVSLARVGPEGCDDRPFTETDQALARNLAEHAALAISNAQLLESRERELAERKRAELVAGRFVSLIQASGEFIAMAGLDGKILFINEGGRKLLGLAPDIDLATLKLTDFHTDDGMKRAPIIQATGRWQGRGQLRHFTTGELIDTQVSSFLVRDIDGEPFGYATVQHDVRETQRLESQLRQAQKMEAVGTLAGGIAHDFNNILSAILGNLELARMDIGFEHRAQRRLDEIAKAGRRAVDLVRQILTVGRQREATKRVIKLGDVVNEAVALLRSTIPAGVELVTAVAPDTPNLLADPTQIHQVLLNLCTNAWQALEGRAGRITISARASGAPAPSEGGAPGADRGRWVRLEVRDTGHGMSAEVVQRIFDPFFTTKPAGEGTGLGLSVVHGIVKDHGGVIRVNSLPGTGTSFEVLIPGVETGVDRPAVPPAMAQANPRRLLYLDDEPALVRTTQALLQLMGHQVAAFTEPAEAFAELRRAPQAFDVVLTDHNMPGMSGMEVAKVVTAIRPDLPVILTSGYVPEHLREQATRSGVTAILPKPATVEDLNRAIQSVTTQPAGARS